MLSGLLARAVLRSPGKVALVHGAERISFSALDARVARCAGGLAARGIRQGSCVAMVLANSPAFVVTLLACARLGAIALPLSPHYTEDERARFLSDAAAVLLVTEGSARGSLAVSPDALMQAVPVPPRDRAFTGPALYLTTSGSTDTFKRVCCTQENLFYEALNFVETVGLTEADTILCTIPLYHSYGLGNCLLDALYTGATLVLLDAEPGAAFAAQCPRVFDLIAREAVRCYPGVPYQFAVLAAHPLTTPARFAGVRLCTSSGDFLPRVTFERFLDRTGVPIRSLYGSTEAGSISVNTHTSPTFGDLGAPLKNVVIGIRDPVDGRRRAPGEAGRIWVKSPTIPPGGYDNRPELSRFAFQDGFYDTGDFGVLDARGHLFVHGRKQSFVDVAGYKVDTAEVEEILLSHPAVIEAAVLGVDVPGLGTMVKAVLVTGGALSEGEVRAWCRERLAFFKIPRLIAFAPRLPRSPIGKVLKPELADVTAWLAGIADTPGGLVAGLSALKPGAMIVRLSEFVRAQAGIVLGQAEASIPGDIGFTELGMDSLSSLELCARLEYATGLQLPATIAFDHPTVTALARALAGRLRPQDAAHQAHDALDRLSRDELTALLAAELNLFPGSSR